MKALNKIKEFAKNHAFEIGIATVGAISAGVGYYCGSTATRNEMNGKLKVVLPRAFDMVGSATLDAVDKMDTKVVPEASKLIHAYVAENGRINIDEFFDADPRMQALYGACGIELVPKK